MFEPTLFDGPYGDPTAEYSTLPRFGYTTPDYYPIESSAPSGKSRQGGVRRSNRVQYCRVLSLLCACLLCFPGCQNRKPIAKEMKEEGEGIAGRSNCPRLRR